MKTPTVVRILNETEFHDFLDDVTDEKERHPKGWIMNPTEQPRQSNHGKLLALSHRPSKALLFHWVHGFPDFITNTTNL